MGLTGSVYSWQGGRREPQPRPECSRARHAELVRASGRALLAARTAAYAAYSKECAAWGREPMDEETWFMNAKGAYCRLLRETKGKTDEE